MTKKVAVQLSALIKSRGISLRELSRLADVRHAALSELANGKRTSINFSHIEKIAEALDIEDIREILTLVENSEE
ncbi:DNA-binding transcriptional regulator, XRE family [Paenibacillus sp. UNCCL117]|uniref:helix-turn-helix domain-containing protein n=1 Tax=unclassified Paenibacillus TaxID=185978 RepID=UPI00088752D0|nr:MULTISPECIES: helix-turn-helix transcriptional regulator [unclassified Paenibacillus]SDE46033.1 DNA-binding transcriptional regulator, XRE family [Paenibacillus sp. cl123]SFW65952.1 DNA-binding transcriptional regulator, XRE family [Paenibacillus sp. UNCCL117]